MEGTKELITTDAIRSKVYILRGQQVMLDQDLAEIYGYQVKNLNQQVKCKFRFIGSPIPLATDQCFRL